MPGPEPKLSREQCLALRQTYADGRASTTTLAARYGVAHSLVARVLRGEYTPVADLPNIVNREGIGRSYGRTVSRAGWFEKGC